jgi:hypothetical protein
MYGHNIVMRLHSFFCTLYTIIYVLFLYPICTPIFWPFWPKKPKKSKKAKKAKKAKFAKKKKSKLSKIWLFWKFLAFLEIFGFLENLSFFGKFCIFWNKFAVCHFRDYKDREYMTQSR